MMKNLHRLVFSCLVTPGEAENQALLLSRSIRRFAGVFAKAPIRWFIPEVEKTLSKSTTKDLDLLEVELCQFNVEPDILSFPFGAKVMAAAEAESRILNQSDSLVWMDTDSIIIREPAELPLTGDKRLGYRPVDHTLIGSPIDQDLDPFWELIYQECSVPDQRIFAMTTSVDQVKIRPYFNAGMLVIRPGLGLLNRWAKTFTNLFQSQLFSVFFEKSPLHKIFFHQAVLAGIVLASLETADLHLLPHLINYPMHMHTDYPADRRPAKLNDLVSFRYDPGYSHLDWRETILISEPLKGWLDEQLPASREGSENE